MGMKKSKGGKIKENDLLKALNEIEEAVAKGDALLEQDTEGGLSTEGEPLSNKAPSGKSTTNKSDKDAAKAMSASDMDDDSEEKPVKKSKKKGFPPPKDDDSDDGSDEGSDDGSDDESDDESADDDMSKSLRDRAEDDEEMSKALDVSKFLEAFVDQTSDALQGLAKSFTKTIEKSNDSQREFNIRLARGVATIDKTVIAQQQLIKSMSEQLSALTNGPSTAPRGKAVLNKSDIAPSPQDDGGANDMHNDGGITPDQARDWLLEKAMAGEVEPVMVTVFEQNHYNPASLPPTLRKALVNDLRK